jgi:SAM-dependent methyltransferase
MGPAASRWAEQLAAWAIPDEILAAAPESPWGYPPELFAAPDPAAAPDTPSRRRAVEALPPAGTVLDVGAGAGASSLGLAPPAHRLVAVDQSPGMLAALAAAADERGVEHAEIVGHWPDVAAEVPPADVVVCHHVAYNVADLAGFALALTDHARRLVVLELTATHPLAAQNRLWRHFHGIDRPEGPTWADAVAVLEEAGLAVSAEPFLAPPRPNRDRQTWVAFVRRRLCLTPERDPEIATFLPPDGDYSPREVVSLWWEGTATT